MVHRIILAKIRGKLMKETLHAFSISFACDFMEICVAVIPLKIWTHHLFLDPEIQDFHMLWVLRASTLWSDRLLLFGRKTCHTGTSHINRNWELSITPAIKKSILFIHMVRIDSSWMLKSNRKYILYFKAQRLCDNEQIMTNRLKQLP